VASGGGSHLGVGGETMIEKEASPGVFLLICIGEREGVVPVLHIGDDRPTACRSGGNAAQRRSPVSSRTHTRRGQFEVDPGHCSTGPGPNH
jgi:hypothetical protein